MRLIVIKNPLVLPGIGGVEQREVREAMVMPRIRWVNTRGLSLYSLAFVCLLLAPWSELSMQIFSMDRAGLEQGEYWRFWSGQLVHSSWAHLLLNLVGLAVLQQLFGEELATRSWLLAFVVLSLFIGLCWYWAPAVTWLPADGYAYVVGISALLHGLFMYAACLAFRRDGLLAMGALLVIGAKVLWEQLAGPSTMTADLIGMPVATGVHLYGFVGGILLGLLVMWSRRT